MDYLSYQSDIIIIIIIIIAIVILTVLVFHLHWRRKFTENMFLASPVKLKFCGLFPFHKIRTICSSSRYRALHSDGVAGLWWFQLFYMLSCVMLNCECLMFIIRHHFDLNTTHRCMFFYIVCYCVFDVFVIPSKFVPSVTYLICAREMPSRNLCQIPAFLT